MSKKRGKRQRARQAAEAAAKQEAREKEKRISQEVKAARQKALATIRRRAEAAGISEEAAAAGQEKQHDGSREEGHEKGDKQSEEVEVRAEQIEVVGEIGDETVDAIKRADLPDDRIIRKASDVPPQLKKYWQNRHNLFSLFDEGEGIHLDSESWYSVTPEAIAARVAHRCMTSILAQREMRLVEAETNAPGQQTANTAEDDTRPIRVLDAFAGAGGNSIAFARAGMQVTAIDISSSKLELLKHNALVYGQEVADRITTRCEDFFGLAEYEDAAASESVAEKYDFVFLSPPWGGVDYLKLSSSSAVSESGKATSYDYYPLQSICAPHGLENMIRLASSLDLHKRNNVVLFLPRNVSLSSLYALAQQALHSSASEREEEAGDNSLPTSYASVKQSQSNKLPESGKRMDVEEQWMGWKLKGITVYLGSLAEAWEEPFREDYGWFHHQS